MFRSFGMRKIGIVCDLSDYHEFVAFSRDNGVLAAAVRRGLTAGTPRSCESEVGKRAWRVFGLLSGLVWE